MLLHIKKDIGFGDKMLRQKYVAGTHCHPICSDNYIYCTQLLKCLEVITKWLNDK